MISKLRTMSICLSDVPKDRILKHKNGKMYLAVQTYDYDEPDRYNNNFSVQLPYNNDEKKRREAGEKIPRIFVGSGRTFKVEENMRPINDNEADEIPW